MSRNQEIRGHVFGWAARLAAIVLLIGGTLPFMAPAAHAAIDAYLRIPGVEGEAKDAAHAKWVAASSVVSGDLNGDAQADREASAPLVSELTMRKAGGNPTAMSHSASAGAPAGKRMHKPFSITKEVDAASPKLAQMCASGQHLPQVDVDMGSAHYRLTDVVIAADTKSGGDRPLETLTFTYQKIEMLQ